jgi:hypothetical protein
MARTKQNGYNNNYIIPVKAKKFLTRKSSGGHQAKRRKGGKTKNLSPRNRNTGEGIGTNSKYK